MKKVCIKFVTVFGCVVLSACSGSFGAREYDPPSYHGYDYYHNDSQHDPRGNTSERGQAAPETVGGNMRTAMDSVDRTKLSHALDSPPGKSTRWTNEVTGINYTVTPTQKLSINGNPYCRKYTVIASKGGKTREIRGTACVTADGSWQSVS